MGGDLAQAVAVLDVRGHGQAGRWNEDDLTPGFRIRSPFQRRLFEREWVSSNPVRAGETTSHGVAVQPTLLSGRGQCVEYVVERRPLFVAEAVAPRLLDLSSGCPHCCVERLASLRQLDEAGAAVRRIWMALDITEEFELSQHVVGRLFRQARCRGDLAWPTPIYAGVPEERDHRGGDVRMSGRVDARQHLLPSQVVRETKPADGARYALERYRG